MRVCNFASRSNSECKSLTDRPALLPVLCGAEAAFDRGGGALLRLWLPRVAPEDGWHGVAGSDDGMQKQSKALKSNPLEQSEGLLFNNLELHCLVGFGGLEYVYVNQKENLVWIYAYRFEHDLGHPS